MIMRFVISTWQFIRYLPHQEGRRVDDVRSVTKGEINTAVDQLPFSDESFKVFRYVLYVTISLFRAYREGDMKMNE